MSLVKRAVDMNKIKELAQQSGIEYEAQDQKKFEDFAKRVIEWYRTEKKESIRELKQNSGYSRIGLNNV